MRKENKDEPILRSSLSTLLKRFSKTDVVGNIEKEYSQSIAGQVRLSLIEDNHILKKAHINDQQIKETMQIIQEKGISSPFFVAPYLDRYEIIIPRISYIASKKLNFESVPVAVLNIDEEEMLLLLASHLRDNKNSSIVELSLVLNRLVKKWKYSQKEIASLMHISRSQVTNIIRLNKLPEWILVDLVNNKLSSGHVRAISTLKEDDMVRIIGEIYEKNLSVRETEKIVYQLKNKVSYTSDEKMLNKKFRCHANISNRRVTLVFDSEEAKNKFIKKMKDTK